MTGSGSDARLCEQNWQQKREGHEMSSCALPVGSRVWAYLRVSGEDQAERGTPIGGQRAEVERYWQEQSLVLTRWFVGEARTGAMEAPGLERG